MNNTIKSLIVIFISVLCVNVAQAKSDTGARGIMELVDSRYDGKTVQSDFEFILIDKKGNRKVRKLIFTSKDYGSDTYKLMLFEYPNDVRNVGFLSYDYDSNRDDDQWLYLPSIRKTKRIANDDKTSAFMGSDFSYADMTDIELDNYDYELLGEKVVYDQPCWLIKMIPRSKSVIDKFGYTKSVVFVRKDINMIVRAVNWLKDGKKIKYFDIKKLKNIEGIWTALEIHMTTKQGKMTEHKTIMNISNVRYDENINDDELTVRRLEKGL